MRDIILPIHHLMNIKQVAARARVSTATVSRTLNQSALVAPETSEKVWGAVRELGYYPNTQARALVCGKSRIFGLIISDISNPFFPELVKSFEYAAIQHNYEVIVANTDYNMDRMAVCVRRMIERKVDGVAIMTSEMDRKLIDELSRRLLPIVFLDFGTIKPLMSNIVVDYSRGIMEAVNHLVSLGHRSFAFISGPLSLPSAKVRRTAVLEHLRACGIGARQFMVVEGNHKIDGGEIAMRQILATAHPTAVIASNDLTAVGALRPIYQAGLSIPRDISLVGFDDIELSQFTHPALTTVRLSREEIGRKALDALYSATEDGVKSGHEIHVTTRLVVRESTGKAKIKSR